MSELEVKGQRGFKIRKRFQHQWNAVVALLHQAFEFKFCDHDLVSVGCVESQHRSFIRSSLGLNTSW
jgi:hypothetical protein